ncbi:MAG: ribonucleotide reductase N-terminal alpha domain-containing protein, partial [Halobacteriaceae archaeon]
MSAPQSAATVELRGILERAHSATANDVDPALREAVREDAERTSYDGASTAERYEAAVGALTAHVDREPALKRAAAAALGEQMERRVFGERLAGDERTAAYRASFVDAVRRGVEADVLDPALVETYDLADLAEAIEPARDDRLEYMAMETLRQRYLLRFDPDGEPQELPQVFWLRVAAGLALEEDDPAARAREFYDAMSTLRFTPSTPTLFHAGTTRPQLSSCYLTTVPDDLEGIFDAYRSHAVLSKYSGGLGNDWTNVRASGSLISSTGVESTGVVPFLRISNDVTAAINRSGKRRGAACAYLAAWHLDFP